MQRLPMHGWTGDAMECSFASYLRLRYAKDMQSHRIVRFLDRMIGCDLAKMGPIGNVCYDLQYSGRTAIDL